MTDISSFSGRTALITGAASGIGAATAEWLAQRDIGHLILIDRDEAKLQALDLSCETTLQLGDVGDPDFWSGLEEQSPKIDFALINAGIASGAPIAEQPFAEWRRLMGVNLDGSFLTLAAVLRNMLKHDGGSIVLTSSVTGIKAFPGSGAYAVSKAAIAHLSKIAAAENAAHGIRVNAVAPGGVDTPIYETDPNFMQLVEDQGREAAFAQAASTTPLKRFAEAKEIAGLIGYLLSEEARNITGAVFSSDGGLSL